LRFERVRKSQLNGEDLRDRWHNALKNLDDNVEIDPEDIKMRVSVPNPKLLTPADIFANYRIDGCIRLMLKRIPYSDGKRSRRKCRKNFRLDTYLLYSRRLLQFRLHKFIDRCAVTCM
jgi:hypothetical protein